MPQSALEALDDAERAARQAGSALRRGETDKGLERQREAQRRLEAARQALSGEREGERGGESEHGPPSMDHADIPRADAHKGPEGFRQRVLKGLGDGSGRFKEAVKRYAEGLLR